MLLERYKNELLLTPGQFKPSSPELKVIGVFNPGVARVKDEIVLIVRVAEAPLAQKEGHLASPRILSVEKGKPRYQVDHFKAAAAGLGPSTVEDKETVRLPHISHFQIARLDADGYQVKTIEPHPELYGQNQDEEYGIEDPRMTEIDGIYYFTYVTVSSRLNVCTSLMSTKDFRTFKRHGVIFPCENKDVILHPERIHGKYTCYHRPVGAMRFSQPSMVVASSENLLHWGEHQSFLTPSEGKNWDSTRIGGGTHPIRTEKGWLQLYHGVKAGKEREYSAGALLTSLDDPRRVIARTKNHIFRPEKEFETKGYMSGVVFPTGWVRDRKDPDRLIVYYGCADTGIAAVTFSQQEILGRLETAS